MGFPDTEAANVLDYLTGRAVADSAPATVYVALLTADPGVTAAMNNLAEDTTAGYARQQFTPSVPTGSPPVTSNSNVITFGPFTAPQPSPITHVVLVTSVSGTGGEVRWVQPLDAAFQASTGDSFTIPAGAFSLSFQS